jgi:hypothetical protein
MLELQFPVIQGVQQELIHREFRQHAAEWLLLLNLNPISLNQIRIILFMANMFEDTANVFRKNPPDAFPQQAGVRLRCQQESPLSLYS